MHHVMLLFLHSAPRKRSVCSCFIFFRLLVNQMLHLIFVDNLFHFSFCHKKNCHKKYLNSFSTEAMKKDETNHDHSKSVVDHMPNGLYFSRDTILFLVSLPTHAIHTLFFFGFLVAVHRGWLGILLLRCTMLCELVSLSIMMRLVVRWSSESGTINAGYSSFF